MKVTKRQRAALRRSDAHPSTVAAVARSEFASGNIIKAAALYRSILESHPRSIVSVEALNFLMLHREPAPSIDSDAHDEWTMPPPRQRRNGLDQTSSDSRSRHFRDSDF